MKKKLDKFIVFLFVPIPIILFTPLFRALYKSLVGNIYGGFGIFTFDESWLEGAIISFIFFLTLFLVVFEIKKIFNNRDFFSNIFAGRAYY